ncbi:MAG: MBL fold metallo-hydrolase [Limnochordia bacterium]
MRDLAWPVFVMDRVQGPEKRCEMIEDGFGDIIGKARAGMGMTLKQLAHVTQLAVERVRLLEECEDDPTQEECRRLALALHLHPGALEQIARRDYLPYVLQNADIRVYSCQVSAMRANAYLCVEQAKMAALLVDPGGDVSTLLQLVEKNDLTLAGVLITHGHADHTAGAAVVANRFRLPVLAHPQEYVTERSAALNGTGSYHVGPISVRALHCPGHTQHGYAFMVGDALFTGDTLFAGSMGRTRSVTAYSRLLESGRRLLALSPLIRIYPGHGPVTTVEQERMNNPFLAEYYSQI